MQTDYRYKNTRGDGEPRVSLTELIYYSPTLLHNDETIDGEETYSL